MADANLKKAMEEIKFVLERYDIAGVVCLSTKDDLEFLYRLDPSWSVVSQCPEKGEVRVTALQEDYPSKELQLEAITSSVNMVMGLKHVSQMMTQNLSEVSGIFERRFDLDFNISDLQPHIAPPKSKSLN